MALLATNRVDLSLKVLRLIFAEALDGIILDANKVVLGTGSQIGGAPSVPRVDRPFVFVRPITLPHMIGAFTDDSDNAIAIEGATITILTAVTSRGYKLRLNGFPANYTAEAGDSITVIRDALLIVLNDLEERATFAAVSTDAISATPDNVGEIYTLTTPTPTDAMSLVITPPVSDIPVEYKLGRRRFTARVTFYSEPERTASQGAHAMCTLCYDALDIPRNQLILRDFRTFIRPISDPVNLTGLSVDGASNEQRASFDISLDLTAMSVHTRYPIETATVSLETDSQTTLITLP